MPFVGDRYSVRMIDKLGTRNQRAISKKPARTSWIFPNAIIVSIGQLLAKILFRKLSGMIICVRQKTVQAACRGTTSSSGNRA